MRTNDRIYELADATPEERCTLYLREGGRFELDRYTGGDCGGTSTTLKGTYELSGELLTLRTEQKVTIEDDATRDLHDVARSACHEVLSVRLQDDGAAVTFAFQGVTLSLARLTPRSRSNAIAGSPPSP